MDPAWASASEIAHAVNTGAISAASVVDEALGVITARDPLLNAFTAVTDARARKRAEMLDSKRAKPVKRGPAAKTDPLDTLIDAAARALRLPIEDAWQPAVAANLRVTLEHAASVEAFALADDAEPAPIFKA